MATHATRRHYRQSPRKVRLVADSIRGMSARRAQVVLDTLNKRAARELGKVLRSAIANAQHKGKNSIDELFVKEIRVDEGTTLKRFIPRAFGRATPIHKRTSHIKIVLGEKETEAVEKTSTEGASSQPEAQTAAS